ncbi:MAG: B12-binding domain-containing radical SAM protein [Acidobacteriota bacterium]
MKALLVYPEHPDQTYWSFSRSLPYIGCRSAMPPLGLITVAAMLPDHWQLRLIDMNTTILRDADLLWADVVLTSTMVVQAASLHAVIDRCHRLDIPVVAGGPYPSGSPGQVHQADHIFVGEAEDEIAAFAAALESGTAPKIHRASGLPAIGHAPVPRFDLLDLDAYASMAIQHSRGCPFGCEFCDIWKLYGRRSRVKEPSQMAAELDALHDAGWRGSVFFVDDNFIGNPHVARRSLATLESWQAEHGFPFQFYTEASVNLGTDDALMGAMRDAGFNFVFLGIESPSSESLAGANKPLNARLDLLDVVRRIQAHGLEVSGGFIVGFDEDTEDIFDRQIAFIREAAIPMAMVGILTAIEGTDLYDRLRAEGRLLHESPGDNTHRFEANFIPRLPADQLAAGYRRVMNTLYDPTLRDYFSRCRRLFDRLGPNPRFTRRIVSREIRALLRSLATIVTRRYGREYLRFLLWCLRRHPARFPEAVRLAIQGFHLEAITREALACDDLRKVSVKLTERFAVRLGRIARGARRPSITAAAYVRTVMIERDRVLRNLRRRLRSLAPDARAAAALIYGETLTRLDALCSEHLPTASGVFHAGTERLAALRTALQNDVDRVRLRSLALYARAGDGVAEIRREIRAVHGMRRAILRRARRRVQALPAEYRVLGSVELQALRRTLAGVVPVTT